MVFVVCCSVDVLDTHVTDGIRPEVIEYCRKLEENEPSLTEIRQMLYPMSLTEEEVLALSRSMRHNTVLRSFHLTHEHLVSDRVWGMMLGVSSGLEELKLNSNRIGNEGAAAIGRALMSHDTRLRIVVLDHNAITGEGAAAVGDALATNTTLESLWFDNNRIGDAGARAIGNGLQHNHTLESLLLEKNDIGDEGAEAIGNALYNNNNHLSILWLGYNRIGDRGCQAIGRGLPRSSIKVLSISNNHVGDIGARGIAEGLRTNTCLQRLWLDHNLIGDEGGVALASALSHNSNYNHGLSLEILSLEFNMMYKRAIQSLSKAVVTNSSLQSLVIAFNPKTNPSTNMSHAMEFCLYRNRLGVRKLLQENTSSLWPLIIQNLVPKDHGMDLVFYLLLNRPDILASYTP